MGMLVDGGRIGGVGSVVVVEISLEKERSDVVPGGQNRRSTAAEFTNNSKTS